MKTILFLLIVCTARAQSLEVRLTNGFVMRQCHILGWTADSITISYVGGTVPVKLANIAQESRAAIEDAKTVATVQAARAQREGPPASASYEVATKPAAPGRTEEQEEAIKHGVAWHELVAGMNEAQVIECMGATPTERFGGALWRYEKRGKGFKNPIDPTLGINDRWLTFRNGLLVSWTDQ